MINVSQKKWIEMDNFENEDEFNDYKDYYEFDSFENFKNNIISDHIIFQKELFFNSFIFFKNRVEELDKNLDIKAKEYSNDFNSNDVSFLFDKFDKNIRVYKKVILEFDAYCNCVFDYIDYVKKMNEEVYNECIIHCKKKMKRKKSMRFYNGCVEKTIGSIEFLLKLRNNKK